LNKDNKKENEFKGLFLAHFCIILIYKKWFGERRSEEKTGEECAVMEKKCTAQLAQCLSTPAHQCSDPLYLRVISWSPSPASRRGDLNSHTNVERFGILSMPDRRVIPPR
jgi:hypothetical protein